MIYTRDAQKVYQLIEKNLKTMQNNEKTGL